MSSKNELLNIEIHCVVFTGTSGASWRDRLPWTVRTTWSSGTQWSLYPGAPGKTLHVCVCVYTLRGSVVSYLQECNATCWKMMISTLTHCKHNLATFPSQNKLWL